MVEAVRIGTIVAHDAKAYGHWQSHQRKGQSSVGLAGASLERTILSLAHAHPDLVDVAVTR